MSALPLGPLVLLDARAPRAGAVARRLSALAVTFMEALELGFVELSLSVVTDADIRIINRDWRDKDQPTDVLSFPAGEQPVPSDAPRPLGDVIISLDTARARAREDGRPLDAELARYLAHGLLHLLGHDHHAPAEARRMARAENVLLGTVGMVEAAGAHIDKPASRRKHRATPGGGHGGAQGRPRRGERPRR